MGHSSFVQSVVPVIKLAVDRRHDRAAVAHHKRLTQAFGLIHSSLLCPNLFLHQRSLLCPRRHTSALLDKLTQVLWDHHCSNLLGQRLD